MWFSGVMGWTMVKWVKRAPDTPGREVLILPALLRLG